MKNEVDSTQWYQDALLGEGEPYYHCESTSLPIAEADSGLSAKEKTAELVLFCVNAAGKVVQGFLHSFEFTPQQIVAMRLQKARTVAERVSRLRRLSH